MSAELNRIEAKLQEADAENRAMNDVAAIHALITALARLVEYLRMKEEDDG